jgi:iron(III) transport system ATP-binding protein
MSSGDEGSRPPGLEVIGVEKSFGGTPVLRGVDLQVPTGALVAVLGPSGCGKTTLLRAVAGFLPIDAGTIRVDGRVLADDRTWVAPERRRVGIVPQEGALFPHLSVGENVAFGIARATDRAARVRRWLDIVGLAHAIDARPHELSGGQQHRVALARALAADPALVLLDEPFSSLDAGLRAQVRAEIADVLRHDGRTAVLVTHDQHEALSMADLVAVLLDGVLQQVAPPDEVYRRPATLAVARFVGEAIVLDARVRDGMADGPLGRHPLTNDAPDGAVHLVLRPEQIVRSAEGVDTVAVRRTFTGPDLLVELRCAGGELLTCRTTGDAAIAVGDPVRVAVRGPVLAYPRHG